MITCTPRTWEFPKIRGLNIDPPCRAVRSHASGKINSRARTATKKDPQFTETAICKMMAVGALLEVLGEYLPWEFRLSLSKAGLCLVDMREYILFNAYQIAQRIQFECHYGIRSHIWFSRP